MQAILAEAYVARDAGRLLGYGAACPACTALHGAVEAAHFLYPGLAERPTLTRVEIGVPGRVVLQNNIAEPTDAMSAQYSVQYSVACALLGWATDASAYVEPRRRAASGYVNSPS